MSLITTTLIGVSSAMSLSLYFATSTSFLKITPLLLLLQILVCTSSFRSVLIYRLMLNMSKYSILFFLSSANEYMQIVAFSKIRAKG